MIPYINIYEVTQHVYTSYSNLRRIRVHFIISYERPTFYYARCTVTLNYEYYFICASYI